MASLEQRQACEADQLRREAERLARDKSRTPLSAFAFRAGSSHGGEIVVRRFLHGMSTGHVAVYRPDATGTYTYRFTR